MLFSGRVKPARAFARCGLGRSSPCLGYLLRCAGPGAVCQSRDGLLAEPCCTDSPEDLSNWPTAGAAALGSGAGNALDVSSDGLEFLDDTFVAPVNMVDAVDNGFAFGDKSGEDEARTGTKIRSLDDGA